MKSVTWAKYVTAALLTRMSGGPSCRLASLTSRSLSSGLDRSARIATAVPPAARICSAVSPIVPGNGDMPAPVVRAATATAAPAAPKRRAISAPMPRLAPVTMATLPSRMPTLITPSAPHRPAADPGELVPG